MKRWFYSLWLALAFVLTTAVASAQTPPPGAPDLTERLGVHAARDLVDGANVTLTVPELPRDYVTERRGPLEISFPTRLRPLVSSSLARAEQDARALAAQFSLATIPTLRVRLVGDPGAMRALAPAEAPPPAYAVGVAYPAVRLALVSATAPSTWEASDMPRVLRHELSHLLLAEATHHAAIPRWLAEGIAVEQAGEHSFERFQELAVASFTGRVVPLRRLDAGFSDTPSQVNAAYAQSADFVGWLVRKDGVGRFGILLAHLREAMTFEDAFRETYGASLTHVEEEWRHDMDGRFALAPLWAGTGIAWGLGAVLLLAATVRRRLRAKATIARWDREEKAREDRLKALFAPRVVVFTPGLGALQPRPSNDNSAPDESDLPRITLEGERHTLH